MPRDLIPLSSIVPMTMRAADRPLEAGRHAMASMTCLRLSPSALRSLLLGLAWCVLWAGSAALWHAAAPLLLLNLTSSVPRGLYVLTPSTTLTRGMLVVFPPPVAVASLLVTRGYLAPQTPLLKPVAALPGETVCVQDDGVFIQGVFVAPVSPVDHLGRPLPRWRGCVTLGAGEVFLLSTWHPRSFDGRYFGPVAVASLLGRATPVWTWGVGEEGNESGENGQDKDQPGSTPFPSHNQILATRQSKNVPTDRIVASFFQPFVTRNYAVPGREASHVTAAK